MSSLPESEYPNVLIPGDTLEPLITYDAKTTSIPPGVKGTREVCISRTTRPAGYDRAKKHVSSSLFSFVLPFITSGTY